MSEPADIVRSKKKGFRVVRSEQKPNLLADTDSSVVARSSSLEQLKAKYLPQETVKQGAAVPASSAPPTAAKAQQPDDLEMLQIEPDTGADPEGPGHKSIIVSRRSGKIVGEQG